MKKLLFIAMAVTALASCVDAQKGKVFEGAWNTPHQTPPFDKISIDDYIPAFERAIDESRQEFEKIISNTAEPTFENTIEALEYQGEMLNRIANIFYPLLSGNTSPEMDSISMEIQPKLTALSNDISLNPKIFARVKTVYDNRANLNLTPEQEMLLVKSYKGFSRSGANLSEADKQTYRKLTEELGQLSLQFSQNALAATNSYFLNITDDKVVEELPDFFKEALAAEAKSRDQEGWTVTLKAPSFVPFMMYSSNRKLKEAVWRAYNTRALGGDNDNREIVKRIANLRLEVANLLGYETYADYVLEERMAKSADKVNSFLDELLKASKKYAQKDYATINAYAKSNGLVGVVQPWDWSYYSELYKKEKYNVTDEMVKPYFQLENVVKGVFMFAEKLYGLTFTENKNIPVYHPDVTAYDVTDESGKFVSVLYLDFFPRESKRSGAWMTGFRDMSIGADGTEIRPLVSLVMNFTKPTETTPSLLTFDEVETFMHEFGHGLHGMLAQGQYSSLTGTSVYRDFVELPSQINENWATEKEFLDMWAVHYQTGEKMPEELINKIIAAKNYQAAYMSCRQLSFGMTDMAWHSIKEPYTGDVEAMEKRAMQATQIVPAIEGTSMSTAFSHIFGGGYAAGYYSYKWAEVLEADAYSLFKEKGIFNREVADSFRDNILSKGGSEDPRTLYVRFRGHEPQTQALIDKMGLK